ncbi:MAG: preprotein translocase subunit YajC [Thermoanaerobaculia bacterium]
MNSILVPIALAEPAPAPWYIQFLPIGIIFAIFYFLLLAPMRKRQRALEALVANLKKGDRVVTNGGLMGEVAAVDEKFVQLKIADNVKVRVLRSAVSGLEAGESPEVIK